MQSSCCGERGAPAHFDVTVLLWRAWGLNAGTATVVRHVHAADGAREQLAAQIEQHTQKAKQARVDEAVGSTEVTLSKIIAVNAVELLSSFPADLWKQLHAARKQVGGVGVGASLSMTCTGMEGFMHALGLLAASRLPDAVPL